MEPWMCLFSTIRCKSHGSFTSVTSAGPQQLPRRCVMPCYAEAEAAAVWGAGMYTTTVTHCEESSSASDKPVSQMSWQQQGHIVHQLFVHFCTLIDISTGWGRLADPWYGMVRQHTTCRVPLSSEGQECMTCSVHSWEYSFTPPQAVFVFQIVKYLEPFKRNMTMDLM